MSFLVVDIFNCWYSLVWFGNGRSIIIDCWMGYLFFWFFLL